MMIKEEMGDKESLELLQTIMIVMMNKLLSQMKDYLRLENQLSSKR